MTRKMWEEERNLGHSGKKANLGRGAEIYGERSP